MLVPGVQSAKVRELTEKSKRWIKVKEPLGGGWLGSRHVESDVPWGGGNDVLFWRN